MERVKGTGSAEEKGRRGLANVVKLSETTLRVDFEATEREKAESFNVKITGEDTLPEYFPFKRMKANGVVKVSATMNKEGDKILFANPANGEFEGHFNKIPCPEGQEPAPETKPGKKGKPYKQFAVLIEVDNQVGTKDLWKGCNYWVPFYPNFGPDADGNLAVAGTGSGSDALYDLMEATGVGDNVIEYSENPLPDIQRVAQAEKRSFKFIVTKGWVTMLIPTHNDVGGAFGEDEEPGFMTEPASETPHPALKDEE